MANVNEIWLPIPGHRYYQVSNFGRVKSISRIIKGKNGGCRHWPEKILTPIVMDNGYLSLRLNDTGIITCVLIHRMVCLAFHPNPKEYVNHKDGNKANNHADNLEWATPTENSRHAFRTGLHIGAGINHYKNRKVRQKDGFVFKSISDAALFFGVSNKVITDLCKGLTHNRLNIEYC